MEAAQQDTHYENKKRQTLFVSIAFADEAEDGTENESAMTQCLIQGEESMLMDETDAQSPEHEIVQVMHAEWVQDLRDVKNELTQVRELVVRRERSAETKAEIAARRLDRTKRKQHEVADAEHEANLQEALTNQSEQQRRWSTSGLSTRAMASGKRQRAKSCSSTPCKVLKYS